MNLELQAQLFQRYPRFFRKAGQRLVRTPDPLHIDMHMDDGLHRYEVPVEAPAEPEYRDDRGPIDQWGIECGDGWHSIIARLAAAIEAEIEALIEKGVGKEEWPRAHQIKEKFGGLRFYIAGQALLSAGLLAEIDAAEQASAEICEQCGQPGTLRRGSVWIHVACAACERKLKRQKRAVADEGYWERQVARQALLDARAE